MTAIEFAQNWGGILGTVVGVVLGAIAAGGGEWWRRRHERKRALATALADLLEARHHAKMASTVLPLLRARVQLPTEALLPIREILDALLPDSADLHARYDAAVTQLASVDPLLAFDMRAKDTLPTMLRNLRGQLSQRGVTPELLEVFENALLSLTLPAIDDALLGLARAHSQKLLRQVKSYLAKPAEPGGFEAAADKVFAEFFQGAEGAASKP